MFFVTYLNCILLLFVGLLGVISVQSKKCVSLMYYFRMKSANPQTIFPQNGALLYGTSSVSIHIFLHSI